MKKLITLSFIGFLSLFLCLSGTAQKIDLEKTYEITGKSKRGQLYTVERNNAGDYILYYITKSTERKVKLQIYTFDKDFNFKDMNEEEIELEKMKTKYKWFKFNGELYSVIGNQVAGLPGTALKLKKKKTTYKYDWLFLGYYKTTEVLEKVKPRTEDGDKYIVKSCPNTGSPNPIGATFFEDDKTGDLYILAGIRNGKVVSKDFDVNEEHTDLHILKFNNDLELVADLPLKFEYPQQVAFARSFPKYYEDDPANPGVSGGMFIFAPAKMTGNKNFKLDPDKHNFTYVHFDENCKLVDRISFKSPIAGWNIDEAVFTTNNGKHEVYIYGPAALGKDKYWLNSYNSGKYKAVQVMKVADNKVQYLTQTDLPEFEVKMKTPPSQKKGSAYAGKSAGYAPGVYPASGGTFGVSSNPDYW